MSGMIDASIVAMGFVMVLAGLCLLALRWRR